MSERSRRVSCLVDERHWQAGGAEEFWAYLAQVFVLVAEQLADSCEQTNEL